MKDDHVKDQNGSADNLETPAEQNTPLEVQSSDQAAQTSTERNAERPIAPIEDMNMPPGDALSFEDLGIHFGLNADQPGKNAHIGLLNKNQAGLQAAHDQLCQAMEASIARYSDKLKYLVDQELLEQISRIDEQKTSAVSRLITQYNPLRKILQIEDEEQKKKLIDSVLSEITGILQEAHEVLAAFKKELKTSLQPIKLREELQQHLEEQKQLLQQFIQENQFENSLERGYAYGESVGKLLHQGRSDKS